jgi:phage FluMu gp28-like protein
LPAEDAARQKEIMSAPIDAALPMAEEPPKGDGLPILLGYQGRWVRDPAAVKIAEKSRRIGLTWAEAFDDVTIAGAQKRAGGMNCFYIGYNFEMAREFIAACAMWAKHLRQAIAEAGEFLFRDSAEDGHTAEIKAFRITFASGFSIIALPSRPRSLRGMQGVVILDEAAFHEDLAGMIKAAMALLMWGGKVRIISTHFGTANAFNELIQDVRSGRKPYSPHRITLDDALADGLYKRICTAQGKSWSQAAQDAWRAELIANYAPNDAEELFCVPSEGGGAYFALAALEGAAQKAVPIVRWRAEDRFARLPDEQRRKAALLFGAVDLKLAVRMLDPSAPTAIGVDFARSGDLTVMWAFQTAKDNRRRTGLVVELRNVPFTEQETVAAWLAENVPRFQAMKLDATGNGAYLAERMQQRFGTTRVEAVKLSADWYIDNFPRLKAAIDDRTATIPDDRDLFADFRLVQLVKGVPRVPESARNPDRGDKRDQRHGDGAVAAVLAYAASRAEPFTSEGYAGAANDLDGMEPRTESRGRMKMRADEGNDDELAPQAQTTW